MPDIQWIKLTTNMFDDEKIKIIESLPDGDSLLIIWIKLIIQAGKTNDGGFIYITPEIPYSEESLATIFNRPINTIRLALKTLHSLEMIEYSHNNNIYLLNFMKYQNIEGMERIRELTRERVAKHREKRALLKSGESDKNVSGNDTVTKCNVTKQSNHQTLESSNVTSNDTLTHGNATDIDKDIDIELDIDIKNINNNIYTTWNSFKILVNHKNLNDKMKSKIKAALRNYSVDEIKSSIKNYATVLEHPDIYFFTYKWTLVDYLQRGIDRFLDEAQPLSNFKKDRQIIKNNRPHLPTSDDIIKDNAEFMEGK
jgi:predicted phage replisome organizer